MASLVQYRKISTRNPKAPFRVSKPTSIPVRRSPLKRVDRQGPPIQDRSRYPQARTKLNPIPEAFQDETDIYSEAHDAFNDQLGEDGDVDMFEWDEPTLVAAMMEEDSPLDPNLQEIVAKANELQVPMSSLSKQTKLDVIRALVPAAKALQDVHRVLNNKIDPAFGDGFLGFDDSCQQIERAARKDQAELVTTLDSALRQRAHLIARLKDSYAQQAQLCANLEASIDAIANHAIEDLRAFPMQIDKTVVQWEKKVAELDRQGRNDAGKSREVIKQFLGNL